MDIIVVLGLFFIFVTITFIIIAFFFPEWVGITGKQAKEIIKSHAGDDTDVKKE